MLSGDRLLGTVIIENHERDFAFARKYDLPIRQVVGQAGKTFATDAWQEWYADKQAGACVNSGKYDGLAFKAAVDAVADVVVRHIQGLALAAE